MKKLVSLVLVGVLSLSLFSSAIEDSNSKKVTASYLHSKNQLSGTPLAGLMAGFKVENEFTAAKIGTLQNNIQNLQIPIGTININNDWGNIHFKIFSYIASAESQKEYYYRMYQYTSALLPSSEILWQPMIEVQTDEAEIFRYLLTSTNKTVVQNCIANFIIFSQLIDKNSNDSFAKEYFKKNGLQAKWDRVRGELKL